MVQAGCSLPAQRAGPGLRKPAWALDIGAPLFTKCIQSQKGGIGAMWNSLDFVERVTPVANRYETENTWFKKQWWGDDNVYILNAWRLYRCARDGAMPFLLLGDTKIRKDPALVMNFGLTSAHGVQEKEELKLIEKLTGKRQELGGPPVLGHGTILSDRNWTPLLNDSFILGGIHAAKDFHLAEEGFNRYAVLGREEFLRRRQKFGAAAPQYTHEPDPRRRWREYLVQHPETLWQNNLPRVFARELIGLQHFGYQPVFTMTELGFVCRNANCGNADFEQYLDALHRVNFQGNDRQAVLGLLGNYLFGDTGALTGPLAAHAHP
jgi:hypothetical protein